MTVFSFKQLTGVQKIGQLKKHLQPTITQSPYNLFGDVSSVLGNHLEQNEQYLLEISQRDENNKTNKLFFNFKSGIVKIVNGHQELIKKIKIPASVFARFMSIDRFAEKYTSFSPYHYAANNPIKNIDINGDSVAIANDLYDYPLHAYSFELFASTPEGKKYIRDRAHAGFEFKGKYIKDLHIKTNREGRLSKKGIDVLFKIGDTGDANTSGLTSYKVDLASQRLKMAFITNSKDKGNITNKEQLFGATDTWTHESFYHGTYVEKSYLKIKNGSEFPNWHGGTRKGLFKINGFESGPHDGKNAHKMILSSAYASEQLGGYSLMQNVARRLELPYTRNKIWQKMMNGF